MKIKIKKIQKGNILNLFDPEIIFIPCYQWSQRKLIKSPIH